MLVVRAQHDCLDTYSFSPELALVWNCSLRLTSFQLPWGHVWPMTDGRSVSLCPARPPSYSSSSSSSGKRTGEINMSQVGRNLKIKSDMCPFYSLNTPELPTNKENWGRSWGMSWYQNGSPLTRVPKISQELWVSLVRPWDGLLWFEFWSIEVVGLTLCDTEFHNWTVPFCAMKWEDSRFQISAPKQGRWACSTLIKFSIFFFFQNKCVWLTSIQWMPQFLVLEPVCSIFKAIMWSLVDAFFFLNQRRNEKWVLPTWHWWARAMLAAWELQAL